jgi:hypothetical protein
MARKNKKEEQEEEYKEEEYEEIIEEDNRVCMFYVIERLDSIMEDCDTSSNNKELHDMKTQLRKFRDELVYNLGINSLNNQIAQNNITDYLK